MKRLTLLKNWNDEKFNASSLHRCQNYINPCRNRQETEQNTYTKAKTMMFFGFATESREITIFFWKLPMQFIASSLLCVNISFVKALRQWRQIREAMKRWNVHYGTSKIQALKRWSVKRFIASLHPFIASSLHRFIASVAQLCLQGSLVETPLPHHQIRSKPKPTPERP